MKQTVCTIAINIGLCLCALFVLAGCTKIISDDDTPKPDPDPVPKARLENISVVIGAANILESRALHGDEYAQSGEFIHSLHLLIVNENNIIEKHIAFDPDRENDYNASEGNLAQYTATIDFLTSGKKTFYAFANMEQAKIKGQSISFDTLLNRDEFKEGESWNGDVVEAYRIENPMVCVDIKNRKFIPMSTKQEVALSVDGQHVTVSLIRLVAKVKMQLANNHGERASISKLVMKSFSDDTPLIKGGTVEAGSKTYEKEFNPAVIVENNNISDILEFYVNETQGTTPFEVELTINDTIYTGALGVSSLERNHVLPVSLHLLKSTLVLDVTASVAPIGGYPVLVNLGNNRLTNNYLLRLPEGCYFTIEGKIINDGEVGHIEDPVTKWEWSVSDAYSSIIQVESALDAQIFAAHLTALPKQTVQLNFEVYEPQQVNNASLTIETVPLQNWDTTYPTSALEWDEKPVWFTSVSLTKSK